MKDKHKKSKRLVTLVNRFSITNKSSKQSIERSLVKKRQNQQDEDIIGYNCGYTPDYIKDQEQQENIAQHARSNNGTVNDLSFGAKSTQTLQDLQQNKLRKNVGNKQGTEDSSSKREVSSGTIGFSISRASGKWIRQIIGRKDEPSSPPPPPPQQQQTTTSDAESESENAASSSSSDNSSISLLTGDQFHRTMDPANRSLVSKSQVFQSTPLSRDIPQNSMINKNCQNMSSDIKTQFLKQIQSAYQNKENTNRDNIRSSSITSNKRVNKAGPSNIPLSATAMVTGDTTHTDDNTSIEISAMGTGTATLFPKTFALYVGDLDLNCSKELLTSTFKSFEGFVSSKIPTDHKTNKSLGYGYVNFTTKENATAAMKALNYNVILNSEIRIMHSIRDKSQREKLGCNIFLANLPALLTTRALYDRLCKYGEILSCKLNRDENSAFALFETREDALNAIKSMDGSYWGLNSISACIYNNFREERKQTGNMDSSKPEPQSELQSRFFTPEAQNLEGGISLNKENISRSAVFGTSTRLSGLKQLPQQPLPLQPFTRINKGNYSIVKPSAPLNIEITPRYEKTQFSLFIKNLPMDITDYLIKRLVSPYGAILDVKSSINTNRRAAWALVAMKDDKSLTSAINGLNKIKVNGKLIRVVRGIPKSMKLPMALRNSLTNCDYAYKVLIGNIYVDLFQKELTKLNKKFPSLKNVCLFESYASDVSDNHNKIGYGFVDFSNSRDCNLYASELKKLGIQCYALCVKINPDVKKNTGKSDQDQRNVYPLDGKKLEKLTQFSKKVREDKIKSDLGIFSSNNMPLVAPKVRVVGSSVFIDSSPVLPTPLHQRKAIIHRKVSVSDKQQIEECLEELLTQMYGINLKFSKWQIHSISTNIIKAYWSGDEHRLATYLKTKGIIYGQVNPIIRSQIIQTASHLDIVPSYSLLDD